MAHSLGALILLRHGESAANAAGLFTGVLDVPLTERGLRQAREATALIAGSGLSVDVMYSSELMRATRTATIVAETLPARPTCPLLREWRLNERNYGALTGRSKSEVLEEYGAAQFMRWRRSVHSAPPPMSDELYRQIALSSPFTRLPSEALTRTESLSDVISRVTDVYRAVLAPPMVHGRNVLVVAHGNSLRALCAILDQLDDSAIEALNLPTGQPLLYTFSDEMTPRVRGGHYLDESRALAAAAEVAHQGGT